MKVVEPEDLRQTRRQQDLQRYTMGGGYKTYNEEFICACCMPHCCVGFTPVFGGAIYLSHNLRCERSSGGGFSNSRRRFRGSFGGRFRDRSSRSRGRIILPGLRLVLSFEGLQLIHVRHDDGFVWLRFLQLADLVSLLKKIEVKYDVEETGMLVFLRLRTSQLVGQHRNFFSSSTHAHMSQSHVIISLILDIFSFPSLDSQSYITFSR